MNKNLYLKIIFFVFFCLSNITLAKGLTKDINPLETGTYSFIDSSKNHIIFPKGDSSYNLFYRKMDSLVFNNRGQVNILHLGGSHIQADVFSNRVRENLVKNYPGFTASRGFVFPFSVAKTNTPSSYASSYKGQWDMSKSVLKNITKPLGLLGIAASTSDPNAEATILLNKYNASPIWFFKNVRIFGFAEHGVVEPVIKLDATTFIHGTPDTLSNSFVFNLSFPKDSLTIVFQWGNKDLQDSLKKQSLSIDSLNTDTLKIVLDTNIHYPTFTLTGILLTNDTPGISYSSIGINGANVPAYLACKNLERDLKFLKPDLLILSIGINDANVDIFDEKLFRAHYDTLIMRIRNVAPDVAILFTTNNDSFRKDKKNNFLLQPNGEMARRAFFTMAEKYHAGVWDMFAIMGGLGSMAEWEKVDLAKKDKVHFNYAGYNLLGDLFYRAIIEAYTRHIGLLPAKEFPQ